MCNEVETQLENSEGVLLGSIEKPTYNLIEKLQHWPDPQLYFSPFSSIR